MEFEKSILFLVCPQEDFIGRLNYGDRRPNRLHVGYEAARQLRGDPNRGHHKDLFVETALRFFDPAVKGSENCSVVVDEDWHKADCPEFEIFGKHCIKGTPGARLAGDLEALRGDPKMHVIRANSLNVVEGTNYSSLLQSICGRTPPEKVRVGVMGVWTNVKVEYLLFNLRTIPPFFPQIAVCEPLCACPKRSDHDAAIEKFEMLGYQIHYDIDSFCNFMGLEVEATVSA